MKKLLCILFVLSILMCSCTSTQESKGSSTPSSSTASKKDDASSVSSKEPAVPQVNNYEQITYNAVDIKDYLKISGRSEERLDYRGKTNGIALDNACNGVSFKCDVEGDIVFDVDLYIYNVTSPELYNCYFTVYVDGVLQPDRVQVSAQSVKVHTSSQVTIATGLSKGEHTIEVYRQSEPMLGQLLLKNITMKGVPTGAVEEKEMLIEFIGDSITAGYGNLVMGNVDYAGSANYSDATQTYAYLTAQNLNADISVIARSGYSYSSTDLPFEELYSATCWHTSSGRKYDFKRQPDVVVINLGTNDAKNDDPSLTEYAQKAVEVIRKYNPDAKIVWAYGLMGQQIKGRITAGIEAAGGEAAGIYFCDLVTDYSGGGGHPYLTGHKNGADILTEFIKNNVL